jgi:hypothetical protein
MHRSDQWRQRVGEREWPTQPRKAQVAWCSKGRPTGEQGGGGVGTLDAGFTWPRPMARAARGQSARGLGEKATAATMWASMAQTGFSASGSGRVHRSGLLRNKDLFIPNEFLFNIEVNRNLGKLPRDLRKR